MRRRWLFVGLALVGTLGGVAEEVAGGVDGLLLVKKTGGERAEGSDGLAVFCRTAVEMLGSKVIKKRAALRIKTLHPEIGSLEQLRIEAEWVEGTTLIRVGASGGDADERKTYSEAVMSEYVKFLAEMRQVGIDNYVEALAGQILRVEKMFESSEGTLEAAREAIEIEGGRKRVEEAEAKLANAFELYGQLSHRLRWADLDKHLGTGSDEVVIIQPASAGAGVKR